VKPTALFKSKVPRFKDTKGETSSKLGPGCYDKKGNRSRMHNSNTKPPLKPEWTKIEWK